MTTPTSAPKGAPSDHNPPAEAQTPHDAAGTKRSFIVVHTNPTGHPFATRLLADNEDHARNAIAEAHKDNEVQDVLLDDGRAEHGYGGAVLPVAALDEEP